MEDAGGFRGRRGLLSASKSSRRRQQLVMQRSFRSKAKIQSLDVKQKRCLNFLWWHAIFLFSLVSLVVCILQILLPPPFGMRMTSAEVAGTGIADGCREGLEWCICPRETVCATDTVSLILLALARCSVFFDYPLYMMMFLSKAHNINNILRRTILREWIDFADMHYIHNIFGVVVGVETMFHSLLHMIRWALNADLTGVWRSTTFITGMVAASCTMLIVWPMAIPSMRTYNSYEVRKGLHYLSWVWAIALLWHAPYRIYYLIGIPSLMYLADYLVGMFGRNRLIENVYFERYGGKGVALHFPNPPGYDCSKTSYVYIMCPWISKWQWHAFSMFPEPSRKDYTMLCVGTNGDWTQEMYDKVKAPCLRSVYVLGPFASEFSDKAVNTTNALAIASGIGITPTLSLVLNYAGKKRVNIVWMCRDPGLVEYFLHKVDIHAVTKNAFAFIFYTGKRDLVLPKHMPLNIFIFRSRPELEETISGIVAAIETGEGLPEEMYENQRAIGNIPFEKRIKIAISRILTIYSKEEMFDYAVEETGAADFVVRGHDDEEFGASELTCESTAPLSDSNNGSTVRWSLNDSEAVSKKDPSEEMLDNAVSIDGLEAMICSFFGGIGEYSRADIEQLFKQVDTDESGYIDKDEFDHFMDLASGEKHSKEMASKMGSALHRSLTMKRPTSLRRSSFDSLTGIPTGSLHGSVETNKGGLMIGDTSTVQYMEGLVNLPDRPLDDWSIFYCGASSGVEKTLRDIEKKYRIALGVEKFDW